MNSPNIPMNAYIFIGVASLVLAFVTVLDNQPAESETSSQGQETSFTDYLPSFNGTSDNSATENQAPSEPVSQSQSYDMFNTNMNSDQGLAQNENIGYQQPYGQQQGQPAQQQQQQPQPVTNPFYGGKNKTGKKIDKKAKKHKKTKSYKGK